jgi:hypothetical protein
MPPMMPLAHAAPPTRPLCACPRWQVPLDITEAHYVKLGDKCIRAKGRDWVNPHEMVAKPPPGMNKDSDDEDDD